MPSCRGRHLSLAVALAAALVVVRPGLGQTWTNTGGDNNWNNAANWSPTGVPNSTSAAVTFPVLGAPAVNTTFPVNIASSVQAGSLTFTDPRSNPSVAGNYTLTSSAGQTLSGLTAITVDGTNVLNTESISLAFAVGGNLLFQSGNSLTITNNGSSLGIGPNTIIGTPGGGGVVVTGSGTTTISGSFADTSQNNNVVGGLTKTGTGTLIFNGSGTNLTGGLTLNGGTLYLDYTTTTAPKLGSGNLTLSGGALLLFANSAYTQSVSGTVLTAGHTDIIAGSNVSGQAQTLNLGPITRSAGATVDFSTDGIAGFIPKTSTGNTNGLLGAGPAYATYSGSTWATNNGGTVGPLFSYSSSYGTGLNTDYAGGSVFQFSATTTNSLRFNSGTAGDLELSTLFGSSGIFTLQSGGILMTGASAANVIGGGTLTTPGGTGDIIVHQYSGNALTINSSIATSGGLTKTGPGLLILGGANTGLTGPINVNRGDLQITNVAAVNSASVLKFNDNIGSGQFSFIPLDHGPQNFVVQLGNGASGTVTANILLANPSSVSVSPGTSLNSAVTLAGQISSAAGVSTPVFINGNGSDYSSAVNLTGANTFTGQVQINPGATLGINSNASLGNATNPVILSAGSSTAGGLVFLNGAVNLARPVEVLGAYATRIVSNGSDVNTISGVIGDYSVALYGPGRVYKSGAGTLILSGVNTYSGGTQVDAGTMSVGADNNLGVASTSLAINTGATLAVTGSFVTARGIMVGPTSFVSAPGNSAVSVPGGQTLTLNGLVADNSFGPGGLLKAGGGTLILGGTNTYSGGTTVQQGTLQVSADANLGAAAGAVTVATGATLSVTGNVTTARTLNLNSGTLAVAAGKTLTFNGATVNGGETVNGGFLTGGFATQAGSSNSLAGGNLAPSASLTLNGSDSLVNYNQGGQLTVAAGQTATMTRVTNTSSGQMTVNGTANVSDFVSNGAVTVNPGGTVTDTGGAVTLGGGSRTFVGSPTNNGGAVNLAGRNLTVAGGLLVNNGLLYDSTASTSVVTADFGALIKGAGTYALNHPIQTINGGRFQSGNSPGLSTQTSWVFSGTGQAGGVNNYTFQISNANGPAGPTPDGTGHVSGYSLIDVHPVVVSGVTIGTGDFSWTATPSQKLALALQTQADPVLVGDNTTGPMAGFNPSQSYSWTVLQFTGTYSGPTSPLTPGGLVDLSGSTALDPSQFTNATNGTFGLALDQTNKQLVLQYTPVPESAHALLACAGAALALARRRKAAPLSSTSRGDDRCVLHSA